MDKTVLNQRLLCFWSRATNVDGGERTTIGTLASKSASERYDAGGPDARSAEGLFAAGSPKINRSKNGPRVFSSRCFKSLVLNQCKEV